MMPMSATSAVTVLTLLVSQHWLQGKCCTCRGRPRSVVASNGAVAADTGTCSQVGLEILQAGGNAVDAGVVSCSHCILHHNNA